MIVKALPGLVLAGLIANAVCFSASAQSLTRESKGQLEFSAPTFGTVEQLQADKPYNTGKVGMTLSLPDGAGPFPAVIISHTVGGWDDLLEGAVTKALLAQGYAVAGLDHFGLRGIKPPLRPGTYSTPAAAVDALLALKLLATHPLIDRNRIGIVGFSMGGAAAQLSAYEVLAARYAGAGGPRFAAHVSVYGTMIAVAMDGAHTVTGAPILFLVGGKDETSPLAKVKQVISLVKAAQPDAVIEMMVFPDAHHAWDSPRMHPVQQGGYHSGACPLFDVGREMGMIAADGSRKAYSAKDAVACTRAGGTYTMLYNEQVKQAADAQMYAFLAKYLKHSGT